MEQHVQQFKLLLNRLPHAKLSVLVMVLVIVYIAFLSSKLVWLLWPQPVTSPLAPISYSNQAVGGNNQSADSIIEQFLFGKVNVTKNTNTAPQTKVINNAPSTTAFRYPIILSAIIPPNIGVT